ncbi:tetratricopeptide (TPR) repeat protein [Nocardioides sp. BE266]|uniref:ATP-binding protein n=1 Tax=Nocardioides sp. BE266 TaxID=2817725 RepID=UPI00286677F3|nr:ATP-binding protein [Nocardioides sp. BE266]MDR7252552.1 tetratricopeptide (TPR) repeat protein [Nocardioides sp. BE266]
MSALPRPDLPPGPARALNDALHDLHHHAGWPSLRTLAAETGVSHTTVSKTFSQPKVPTWGTVEVLVDAMDGDTATFHDLWRAASAPTNGAPEAGPQIAGRRAELDVVRRHLEAGTGLLLVTGEAGIGKTTLVTAAAGSSEAFVAVGRCLNLSQVVPMHPVIEALRMVLACDDGDWMTHALATCPAYVSTSLVTMVPELAPRPAEAWSADDPWGVERLFASISTLLRALRDARPLAVHLEDGHLADQMTLDLTTHLANGNGGVPLVLTWRTGDQDVHADQTEWLARTRWTTGVDSVDLTPLTRADTAEQLRLITGAEVDPTDADKIHSRSQGLPLYTAQLAAGGPDSDTPSRLVDLIDRRIGALGGDGWSVARVLGVAQRPLTSSTLMDVAELTRGGTEAGLRILAGRGLVRSGGDDAGLSHPLFIEAIERRMVPGEAAQVHARLAGALARAADAEPAEIADHWQQAGRPDLEAPVRVAAARRAAGRFAWPQALAGWLRTLALADAGVDTGEVAMWEVVVHGGEAALDIGDMTSARDLFVRAEALVPDLPPRERALLMHWMSSFLVATGEAARGLQVLDEAVHILEQLPASPDLWALLGDRFELLMLAGRWTAAQQDLDRALADEALTDPRARRRLLSGAAWVTRQSGDYSAALDKIREGRSIQLAEADPLSELMLTANETDILLHANAAPREIEESARAGLEHAAECRVDQSYIVSLVRCNVCIGFLRAGHVGAAREIIAPVTASAPTINSAAAHLMLAATRLREGDVSAAVADARTANSLIHAHDSNWAEGVPWHAEVELWAEEVDAALELLEEAVSVALSTQVARVAAPLMWAHARAHADRLVAGRKARSDGPPVAARITELVAGAESDPFGPEAVGVARIANLWSWEAELLRLQDGASTQAWVRAAEEWDRLERPHDAAYCRWRAAECALREGRGTIAARLLTKAAADAREHVPLSRAIARTAAGHR